MPEQALRFANAERQFVCLPTNSAFFNSKSQCAGLGEVNQRHSSDRQPRPVTGAAAFYFSLDASTSVSTCFSCRRGYKCTAPERTCRPNSGFRLDTTSVVLALRNAFARSASKCRLQVSSARGTLSSPSTCLQVNIAPPHSFICSLT